MGKENHEPERRERHFSASSRQLRTEGAKHRTHLRKRGKRKKGEEREETLSQGGRVPTPYKKPTNHLLPTSRLVTDEMKKRQGKEGDRKERGGEREKPVRRGRKGQRRATTRRS